MRPHDSKYSKAKVLAAQADQKTVSITAGDTVKVMLVPSTIGDLGDSVARCTGAVGIGQLCDQCPGCLHLNRATHRCNC